MTMHTGGGLDNHSVVFVLVRVGKRAYGGRGGNGTFMTIEWGEKLGRG